MEIWPAIDLLGGKCVRLQQGDYDRKTVFSDIPSEMAQQWVSQSADRLHLVDLDGARDGEWINEQVVRDIVSSVAVPCQLGGGVRDEQTISRMLNAGLSRLVVGTQAIKRPDWFRSMCEKYPHKLALGIDAKGGLVATDGWLEVSEVTAIDLARQFVDVPIDAIIYTDIAKDGMLQGPNFEAMQQMSDAVDISVIASGGVTTADDVSQLTDAGLAGCIIGRSLYEGQLELAEALEAAAR